MSVVMVRRACAGSSRLGARRETRGVAWEEISDAGNARSWRIVMLGNSPTIMVSSTFFDLKEIRQQLAAMISSELGYHALISESPSFPVEPDVDTIENCKRRVERDADILVLVIGS